MKKLFSLLLSRMFMVGSLILVQLIVIIVAITNFSQNFTYFYFFCMFLSIVAVLWIISSDSNPSYKLALIMPILIFPVFGGLFYLFFGTSHMKKKFEHKLLEAEKDKQLILKQDEDILNEIFENDLIVGSQVKYILNNSNFPVYKNTETKYLSPGESFFECLKKELMKANSYIFMEYFILKEGKMWNEILDILILKASQGVDVRVIYDDIGCLNQVPFKYSEHLQKFGIKCAVFNPFMPIFSVWHNNRDHRKITVIDGHTAFTGGANLADEYINAIVRFGHWKDSSIMIKGDAVSSFTVMFLTLWISLHGIKENLSKYIPDKTSQATYIDDGYVLPYGDIPIDNETLGANVYLNMISKAKKYVYICTPYFVVDNETLTALCLAAKSGIDVRIITPHMEDKWYVHMLTRSYYPILIESGVKVYEYTPGFIHSKTVVSDDVLGIVGTINFDYRSLYLHFECATLMYKSRAVDELKEDFNETLKVCERITLKHCNEVKWYIRLIRSVMRMFAPLL